MFSESFSYILKVCICISLPSYLLTYLLHLLTSFTYFIYLTCITFLSFLSPCNLFFIFISGEIVLLKPNPKYGIDIPIIDQLLVRLSSQLINTSDDSINTTITILRFVNNLFQLNSSNPSLFLNFLHGINLSTELISSRVNFFQALESLTQSKNKLARSGLAALILNISVSFNTHNQISLETKFFSYQLIVNSSLLMVKNETDSLDTLLRCCLAVGTLTFLDTKYIFEQFTPQLNEFVVSLSNIKATWADKIGDKAIYILETIECLSKST